MSATSLRQLPEAAYTAVGSEVFRGLTAHPKTLSPWLFYDAEGSRLFEAITELPEYYVTRTERGILAEHADEIVAAAGGDLQLMLLELGAGTATKTGLLLQAAVRRQGPTTYRAIDVSESALQEATSRLQEELPGVTVETRVADYTEDLGHLNFMAGDPRSMRRLVLYIGSSIGNFAPGDAMDLLRGVRAQLLPGECLLLGADRVKDPRLLVAAYDDRAGVTSAFNKNVLTRINRELEAAFQPHLFRHKALWNPHCSRMEMHLQSLTAQQVCIASLDLEVRFAPGETIHTENSYKFTDESIGNLLESAGFSIRQQWQDEKKWFGVYLAVAR